MNKINIKETVESLFPKLKSIIGHLPNIESGATENYIAIDGIYWEPPWISPEVEEYFDFDQFDYDIKCEIKDLFDLAFAKHNDVIVNFCWQAQEIEIYREV